MKRKDAGTDGESGADERLHSAEWMDALARIETMRPRVASIYRRLLREFENGWKILQPLASAARPMAMEPDQPPLAESALWVIGGLADDYLELAKFACDVVPGALVRTSVVQLDEIYLSDPQHLLRLLRASAADPAFPANLRALCLDASPAYDRWLTDYVAALQPLREREAQQSEKRLREQGFDVARYRERSTEQAG